MGWVLAIDAGTTGVRAFGLGDDGYAVILNVFTICYALMYPVTGWLVDNHIEPAVGGPGWGAVAPLVGSQPGAGMGLVLVITGLLMLTATLAMLASPAIRRMETDLPDYAAEEPEPLTAEAAA